MESSLPLIVLEFLVVDPVGVVSLRDDPRINSGLLFALVRGAGWDRVSLVHRGWSWMSVSVFELGIWVRERCHDCAETEPRLHVPPIAVWRAADRDRRKDGKFIELL